MARLRPAPKAWRRIVLGVVFVSGAAAVTLATLVLVRDDGDPFSGAGVQDIGLRRVVVAASAPPDPWTKDIADVDGDGDPDLVVGGAAGPTVWYRNPGWARVTIAAHTSSQSGSAAGDIDGDGDVDVVIGSTWYESADAGRKWTPHAIGRGGTHDIVLADIDGDGALDVAMRGETGSTVDVFFQRGHDEWAHVRLDPGFGRNGLAAGDLDGDGDSDLVLGGRWLENPGGRASRDAGSWTTRSYGEWSPWAAVDVVDLNHDGRLDVLLSVSEQVGDVAWFEAPRNARATSWKRHVVATGLNSVHAVDAVDMNGDGSLDVVAVEFRGAGRLLVFLAIPGSPPSWATETVARGEDLHNVRVGDLDGDGLPDLFGAAPFGDQPVVLFASDRVQETRVLVFSRTLGFRHDSIPHAVDRLTELGERNGFTVDATEDARAFTPSNLARYEAVVFLNPSGDVLDASQRDAFRRYVESGRGFVGIHNATALVLEDWPWYTGLVGARYKTEITTRRLVLRPVEPRDPSTRTIPDPWLFTDEAYNFDVSPTTRGVRVLLNLDESRVAGGTMGRDHPFSWRHVYRGGRSWYTNGGANSEDYDDPLFMAHLLGGIRWAGGF